MRQNGIASRVGALFLGLALAGNAVPSVAYAQESEDVQIGAEAASGQESLPQKFDMRDKGAVSPVKNQNPWGSCWAFGALAASESNIYSELGTTYDASKVEFSPRHLAWFASTALSGKEVMEKTPALAPYASQAGEGMTILYGNENVHAHPLETGGMPFLAAVVLASGMGPVTLQDVPYKNNENMAEYACDPDKDKDYVGSLKMGQTLNQFLAEHPGVEYRGFRQEIEPQSPSNSSTQSAVKKESTADGEMAEGEASKTDEQKASLQGTANESGSQADDKNTSAQGSGNQTVPAADGSSESREDVGESQATDDTNGNEKQDARKGDASQRGEGGQNAGTGPQELQKSKGDTVKELEAKPEAAQGTPTKEASTQGEGEEEPTYSAVRSNRVEATPERIASGLLTEYAAEPIFDAAGNFIQEPTKDTPVYDWSVDESQRFTRRYELEEANTLPQVTGGYAGQPYNYNEAATRAIKQELLAGKGVTLSLYDDTATRTDDRGRSQFINRNSWSQYVASDDGKIYGAAHNVNIVGWDDTWAVDNFDTLVGKKPPAPGAWIIKNSYGAEGAGFPNEGKIGYLDEKGKHSGYMRVSYYDMSLTYPTSFNYDSSGHISDFINQYDLMTASAPYTQKYNSEVASANVFTAAENQNIHALSVETEKPNTHVELELWKLNDGAKVPTDGTRVATIQKDVEWGGYHRFSLEEPSFMNKGQRFSVVARLTTTNDGATTYQVPVHRDVNESAIKKYGKAVTTYVTGVVNEGESYILREGSWKDWSGAIKEGQAAGAKLEAEGVKDLNAAIDKQEGALNPYYDYDNISLKAFSDAASEAPVAPEQPQPQPQQDSASKTKLAATKDASLPNALVACVAVISIMLLGFAYSKTRHA